VTPNSNMNDLKTKEDHEEIDEEEVEEIEKHRQLARRTHVDYRRVRLSNLSVNVKSNGAKDSILLTTDDLTDLHMEQRIRLFTIWKARFLQKAKEKSTKLIKAYEEAQEDHAQLKRQIHEQILEDSSIIGMTTTGFALNVELMAMIEPKVLIVEEAAEVLESNFIATLQPTLEHIILIGDHKQLRPNLEEHHLKRNNNFDVSIFERLVNNLAPLVVLGQQNRMRPEFAELLRVAGIYPHLKDSPRVSTNSRSTCVEPSLFFLSHNHKEKNSTGSRSQENVKEAELVLTLANWMVGNGVKQTSITILGAYLGQVRILRLKRNNMKLNDINVQTIDRFQGEENEYIIVSLVRSKALGYLSSEQRMCVGLSRAKCGLYIFGNARVMSSNNKWYKVIKHLEDNNLVNAKLPLICSKCRTGGFFLEQVEIVSCPRCGNVEVGCHLGNKHCPYEFSSRMKSIKWALDESQSFKSMVIKRSTFTEEYDSLMKLLRTTLGEELFAVKDIIAVINGEHLKQFKSELKKLHGRHFKDAFKPKWPDESTPEELVARTTAIERLRKWHMRSSSAKATNATLVPFWHCTSLDIALKICSTGFASLQRLDEGWYGKGMYGTPQAEYAWRVYRKNHKNPVLLLAICALGHPYPVIHKDFKDDGLMGKSNVGSHDSHWVPITSKFKPPVDEKEKVIFDEIVLFQEASVLPCAIFRPC